MPRTAFTTYLVDPDATKTCTTEKKQAYEMCSVLLTLLFYLVMSKNMNTLDEVMGGELSEYVKLFDLTLLLEAFLRVLY